MCKTPNGHLSIAPDAVLHSGSDPPASGAGPPAEPLTDPPSEQKEAESAPQKNHKVLKRAIRLVLKLGIVCLAGWLTMTYIFGIHRVSGNDMYPALRDGDLCLTYKIGPCYAGDTVAYETPDGLRMGRVVAREGDRIDGDEKGLVLNGAPPAEEIFYPTQILNTALALPYTLKEGEYLVLNDYRPNLHDSRTYGVINEEALHGKVIFLFRRRGF